MAAEAWKYTLRDALRKIDIPRDFTGKIVVTMQDGQIRFMEICQTVK